MTYAIAVSFLGFVQEYNPRFALARLQQLSANEDVQITWQPVFYPVCARDLAVAGGVISEEMIFLGALVPRRIVALWLEMVQGNHPTMEDFAGAREQLYRKVKADRTDPFMLAALALADVALGPGIAPGLGYREGVGLGLEDGVATQPFTRMLRLTIQLSDGHPCRR
jgi:hypothetical protein